VDEVRSSVACHCYRCGRMSLQIILTLLRALFCCSFIDTDEYLVPMKHDTWTDLLDDMESKNIEVLKMRSSRGLPRHDLMQ
jgi:hypothetical protein